ncbi:alpha/beta fold hydrolase [Leptospira idonii]|uniref:Alpha/beta hydrolase n=1 Tax=Leptospira idonii TaxID=1193500 RepID=A0A4R9LZF2_9LEPT|nr:alpha/beta hydrolase [Leptospira idonii]TGN19740.1 alpha/beta hydrolase [Leptospira idonii]
MSRAKNQNLRIIGDAKKTILFAHGFGTDQSAWDLIYPHFAPNYRLVLFDNIGSGKTDPNLYSHTRYSNLYAYAEDLIQIMDEIELKDVLFIGHSVSSIVGLLASSRRPDLFQKLAVIGASPRYLNDENYIGGFTQEDLNQLYGAMETNFFTWTAGFAPAVMKNEDNPELAKAFEATLRQVRPDIALSVAKTIFQSDHRKDLPNCKHNILVLQPSADIAVPMEVGKYLEKNLPNGKTIHIKSSGHFPHISAPEQVLEAFKGFID